VHLIRVLVYRRLGRGAGRLLHVRG
jgi:hypothetical protein